MNWLFSMRQTEKKLLKHHKRKQYETISVQYYVFLLLQLKKEYL